MLCYLSGMRAIAAMSLCALALAGCGRDAALGSAEDGPQPSTGRKAASSPASVIPVLGVRG